MRVPESERQWAIAQAEQGASYREIESALAERDVHVSHETIRGWHRRAAAAKADLKPLSAGTALVLREMARAVAERAINLKLACEADVPDRATIKACIVALRAVAPEIMAPRPESGPVAPK